MSTVGSDPRIGPIGPSGKDLDVARDSDVPISTQIYWQLVYQIDSGRLLPGARPLPPRRPGAGTAGGDRPPKGRRPEARAGIVSEMMRRFSGSGFSADELAAATFAAA